MANINKLIPLVEKAKSGSETALSELFSACYDDIYYFAFSTLKDENIACDITQETCITILNEIGNLREARAFPSWSRQITYRHCLRYFNKNREVTVEETEDGGTIFDTLAEDNREFIPDEAVDRDELSKTVMDMIGTLSEELRSAVLLYYFDELSVDAIAEVQGVSSGTVKSRLNYARKSIKKSVEDYEKKTGTKLHCAGVLPLLLWLLKLNRKKTSMAYAKKMAVKANVEIAVGASCQSSVAAVGVVVGAGAKSVAIKIVAGVAAAAVIAGAGFGAYTFLKGEDEEKQDKKEKVTQAEDTDIEEPDTSVTVDTDADEPIAVIPDGEKYESETLAPYGTQYKHKNTFDKFIGKTASYYFTDDGKLYSVGNADDPDEYRSEIMGEPMIYGNYAAYRDDRDFIHLYVDGGYYVVSGAEGDVVYAFCDMLSGEICLITKLGNKLLYSTFEKSGINTKYSNAPLSVYDYTTRVYYDTIDKLDVVDAERGLMYIEAGGVKFYDAIINVSFFSDIPQIWPAKLTDSAHKILDYGYTRNDTSPIYTKAGEDTTIFYEDGLLSTSELPVYLPEGYAVSNIKKVVFGYYTTIWFDDDTIWTGELTHTVVGVDFEKNEELSKLACEGHIKDLYVSHHGDSECATLALLDDNVLYEVLKK